MGKRVQLLKLMSEQNIEMLNPINSVESSCGYRCPQAQEIFETEPGKELEVLDHMADLGLFDRRHFDKVRLCPFCRHFSLNFREVCPKCESTNIDSVPIIHHLHCGYVAEEKEFRNGLHLICPKCTKPLRHVGVDYERPTAHYRCVACAYLFPDPDISCLSLTCGKSFKVDQAWLQTIYAYRITAMGLLASTNGVILEREDERFFMDVEAETYTFRFFEELGNQEIRRSARYQRSLFLLVCGLDRIGEYENDMGMVLANHLFKALTRLVREELRDCDCLAIYQKWKIAILLPDTPPDGGNIVAERIRVKAARKIQESHGSYVTVSLGISEFSESLQTVQAMLTHANARLREAQEAGGNCIRFGVEQPEAQRK